MTTRPTSHWLDRAAVAALQAGRRGSADGASKPKIDTCGLGRIVLLARLVPVREAMDEVFRCDTAFGTCVRKLPSAGHCMLASMVVQDLFGGEILGGEVQEIPHYWNRISAEGRRFEIDLTGDQFGEARIRTCTQRLYPGKVTVFARYPGASLEVPLNQEIMRLHRKFLDRLIPELRRQGRKEEAGTLRQNLQEWTA